MLELVPPRTGCTGVLAEAGGRVDAISNEQPDVPTAITMKPVSNLMRKRTFRTDEFSFASVDTITVLPLPSGALMILLLELDSFFTQFFRRGHFVF